MRRAQVVFLVVACGLVVAALQAPVVWASASANWSPGVQAVLPTGAKENPYSLSVPSVSCPSPGGCVAVGEFLDGNSHFQGLLLTQASGRWATGRTASLPAGAAPDPNASLTWVSCPSPGNCTAVGTYHDGSGHTQGLLWSESSGTWASAVRAVPPGNAQTDPEVSLSAVSCSSPGNCAAVGSYIDNAGHRQGLLLDESSGAWATGLEVVLPGTPLANPSVGLSSVSCPANGDCTAVGDYEDSSMHFQGLLVSRSGGAWAAGVEALPPGNAGSNPGVLLESVSCPSPGTCSTVGIYRDSSTNSHGLLLTESGGTWASGTEAKVPHNGNAVPNVSLSWVSCPSAGNCTAVGGYSDSSSHGQGLLLTETTGVWGTGVEAVPPANHGTDPGVFLSSVKCVSAGACEAVGSYSDASAHQQGLLVTGSSGRWADAVQAFVPANAGTNPGVVLSSVSCASAGNCAASGLYHDQSGAAQGLLVGAAPATPRLTARAPAKGTVGRSISPGSLTAELSGGARPIGTITFTVFGPRSTAPAACGAGGTAVGSATVSGDGTYRASKGFTPRRSGRYWWFARYGGDAGDNPAQSSCGRAMANTVVAKQKPPRTAITRVTIDAAHRTAKFAFRAGGATGFRCALLKPALRHGKPRFARCHSPKSYAHLRHGKYVFEVRAVSSAGAGPVARHRFTI
jgi:hypothetical protein